MSEQTLKFFSLDLADEFEVNNVDNFCRVVGAAIIVGGLYLVLWGKSKDYLLILPSPIEGQEINKGEEKLQTSSNHQMEMASHDANLISQV